MSNKKNEIIISVSHEEDIDGIASASIILRFLGVDYLFLTNYHFNKWRYFVETVKRLCYRFGKESTRVKMYITDLNLKPFMIRSLDNNLSNCSLKEVYWIDHHKWDSESIDLVNSLNYFIIYGDKNFSATENLVNYLNVSKDPVANILAYLSRDSDFGLMKHVLTQPLTNVIRYIVYISRNKLFLKKLVKKFSRGILWDHEINSIWKNSVEYINKALEETLRSIRIIEVNNRKILYTLSSPALSSKLILGNIYNVKFDLAVIIYTNGSVTISRGRNDIDCSVIARALGGGGHEHIAGAQISPKIARDLNKAINMITEKIRYYI
ncbi:MAG: hypothetical protein ACP5GI_00620 [Sulfolobales archaeon]